MRGAGLFNPVPAGLWCDSSTGPARGLFGGGAGVWLGRERLVCHFELWAKPCMELVGRASGVGLGVRLHIEFVFCDVVCAYLLGVFIAGIVGATKCVEPITRECLLCANLADMGAGAVHPLQWFGSVAGVALALHRVDVCDLTFNGCWQRQFARNLK